MPRKCCIEGCINADNNSTTLDSNISFHLFSKDEELKLNWKHYIVNQEVTGKNSIVCSAHFHPSDVIKLHSKNILKSCAIPKIFPNSSPSEDDIASDVHGTIELPVFVSVDESSTETDKISQIKIEPADDNTEVTSPAFISVNEKIYKLIQTSTLPNNEEIFESASTDHTITSTSSERITTPVPTDDFSNEPNQISSEFMIKDEIDEDWSPAPSDSSGECVIVEPPNPSTNTFTNTAVSISNLSMRPSLNPPMHPSLYELANLNSNVAKVVPSKEHETPARVVRYAGDIDEFGDVTLEDARKNLTFCKTKIKDQAKEIYRFKQNVRRQKTQTEKLRNLLKKYKTTFGSLVPTIPYTWTPENVQSRTIKEN